MGGEWMKLLAKELKPSRSFIERLRILVMQTLIPAQVLKMVRSKGTSFTDEGFLKLGASSPCAELCNVCSYNNAQRSRELVCVQRDIVSCVLSSDAPLIQKTLCLFIVSVMLYILVGERSVEDSQLQSLAHGEVPSKRQDRLLDLDKLNTSAA